jgi:ribosomal protein S18 acetylase RimI-like enzyme
MNGIHEQLEMILLNKDLLKPASRLLARYMKGSYGLDEELATKGVKSLPDLMEDGVAQFYMAKLERDWVGFVVVCWGFSTTSGKPILRIQDIYVEPEFRNRGIGTGLLAFCEKLAKTKGAGSIRLETNADNRAARKLYEKAGFVEFSQRLVCMKFLD